MAKTLILGLGNDILTDDGIGPQLIRSLSASLSYPWLTFNTASSGGFEIMEYIRDYERAVFIDSIITSAGIPGTVYYFQPDHFRETLHLSNLHDISFLTAIRLGKELELNLPTDLHIIAVEIVEDLVFDTKFTPELQEKYPEILKKVNEIICKIILTNNAET